MYIVSVLAGRRGREVVLRGAEFLEVVAMQEALQLHVLLGGPLHHVVDHLLGARLALHAEGELQGRLRLGALGIW